MVRIGLIDSGININHPLITKKEAIINGWTIICDEFNDTLGHGTQCAYLILSTLDSYISDIEMYNIKVFDKNPKASSKTILNAIQWCIDNNVRIINLSLSINDINYYYEFKRVCDEAYKKRIIIVAAADNAGFPCLPAYFNNVFGVGIANLENEMDFYYINSPIQLYASGKSPELNTINISATSFATARMTGKIATKLLENENLNFSELTTLLQTEATPYQKEKIIRENQDIDLNKYTIPISLNQNNDIESIIKELRCIPTQHIVNNQIVSLALINLTGGDSNISDIELKINDHLKKENHTIISINPDILQDTSDFTYSYHYYKQMPENLHAAYAKALIETSNNNHSNAELIMIRIDNPIIPFNLSRSFFFDIYTISELSLLFGFQVDFCVLVINELTEFKYIERNLNCLKSLYDADVIFLIYNRLYKHSDDNESIQHISNIELLKKISDNRFLKLQNELNCRFNLNLYDINDEKQIRKIYTEIIESI